MEREELYSRSCYKRVFNNGVYDVVSITRIYKPTEDGGWKFLVMDEYLEGLGIYDTLDDLYKEHFDNGTYSSFEEIGLDEYILEVSKKVLEQGVWSTSTPSELDDEYNYNKVYDVLLNIGATFISVPVMDFDDEKWEPLKDTKYWKQVAPYVDKLCKADFDNTRGLRELINGIREMKVITNTPEGYTDSCHLRDYSTFEELKDEWLRLLKYKEQ